MCVQITFYCACGEDIYTYAGHNKIAVKKLKFQKTIGFI